LRNFYLRSYRTLGLGDGVSVMLGLILSLDVGFVLLLVSLREIRYDSGVLDILSCLEIRFRLATIYYLRDYSLGCYVTRS
jgi:uncharacterized membrane protein